MTTYVITGVLTNGQRFKPIRTNSLPYALGINLYRGTVWVEHNSTGKRTMLSRTWNW